VGAPGPSWCPTGGAGHVRSDLVTPPSLCTQCCIIFASVLVERTWCRSRRPVGMHGPRLFGQPAVQMCGSSRTKLVSHRAEVMYYGRSPLPHCAPSVVCVYMLRSSWRGRCRSRRPVGMRSPLLLGQTAAYCVGTPGPSWCPTPPPLGWMNECRFVWLFMDDI
jgi:hypothetical protein